MQDTYKVAIGGAVGAAVYELIRFGIKDFDWLGPIVVGVVAFVMVELLNKLTSSDEDRLKRE